MAETLEADRQRTQKTTVPVHSRPKKESIRSITMYIRRSLTRTTDNATRYYSFRLCHSERIEGKVRQKTLLNLGAHFHIDKRYWRALCSRTEALLKGQLVPMGVAAVAWKRRLTALQNF